MLNALKKLINSVQDAGQDGPEDDQLLPLAAAMLLLEVAWADQELADTELNLVEKNLQNLFNLPPELTGSLVKRARAKLDVSVGFYDYTRTINDSFNPEEKFELMVALWRLALSDHNLDAFEEHAIRRISELLYVPHSQFIRAKQAARDLSA